MPRLRGAGWRSWRRWSRRPRRGTPIRLTTLARATQLRQFHVTPRAIPALCLQKGLPPSMFVSFFPQPRLFFWSVLFWVLLAIAVWYRFGDDLGLALGILSASPEKVDPATIEIFLSPRFIWFDLYYVAAVAAFFVFWKVYAPH